MMLNSKSLGNKIAEARKQNQLSQSEVAQRISISPQAVGKWERGESMPDVATLNRLAELLGVDLNYFSESFSLGQKPVSDVTVKSTPLFEEPLLQREKFSGHNWNMSEGNWTDADFSGLKNIRDKFSNSNLKNCKFTEADLSGLILAKNNIELCDFTSADIRNSKIQSSNLIGNQWNRSNFIDSVFMKSNIGKCDFTEADFSGAEFFEVNFENNIVKDVHWKFTAFKRSNISDVIFEGAINDCHFENCAFYNVRFQNAVITNSFFKYNRRFKKVQFIDCNVDKITHAFLKSNEADLSGITIIS